MNNVPIPPKLVIFDLDGTLLDTLDDLSAAVNFAMQQRGFPQHTHEEYRMMVGHGARNLMTKALPAEHREDNALIDAVLADFRTYYNTHIDVFTKPFPGIPELLVELHRKGIKLAVASNKFQEGTEHLIKEFFPHIPFVAILGNRPGYPLKPAPAVVGEILRIAGLQKDNSPLSLWRGVGGEAPISFSRLQQAQRSHHVGLGESEGILDGAVHMGFGSKMDDAVNLLVLHQLIHAFKVADVHTNELIVRLVLNVLEVGEVASVCQLIEVNNLIVRIFVHKKPDDMATDESSTAGNEDSSFHF